MEAIPYLPSSPSLEELLASAFKELGVLPEQEEAVRAFLGPLRVKSDVGRFHYEHSIRVGLLAKAIGASMGLDSKALFYAGLLHDIGKALVTHSTLGKTQSWTPEDSKVMESHVTDSYRLLRDKFDFTAQIAIWHHRFQPNCYPAEVPPPLHEHSTGTEVIIHFYGRLLMLADTFDAMHRVNYRDGQVVKLTPDQIHTKMVATNPDLKPLVERLYEIGVFVRYGNLLG
jgi:putative nucleotidyltransferase with HDIG domain